MSKPIISIIGSLNVDLVTRTLRVPTGGETLTASSFDTHWGGKGANQAVASSRLSRNRGASAQDAEAVVRMVGAVGDDQFADDFLASLSRDGLDVTGVRKLPGEKTGVAVIIVEERTGENRILLAPNANGKVPKENLLDGSESVVLFQLEIPFNVVVDNIELAKSKGISVILNPAPAVPLPDHVYKGLGHLIVNETEAALLSGTPVYDFNLGVDLTAVADLTALSARFIEKGVTNVVITLGAHGVFYHTAARNSTSQPGKFIAPRKVKVVDTTAAGDTFVGAYALAIARGMAGPGDDFNIDAAIDFANRAASIAVTKAGAQSSIPWRDEVPQS